MLNKTSKKTRRQARITESSIEQICREANAMMAPETKSAYLKAMPRLRLAAAQGDAWAQYHLGMIYDYGLSGKPNRKMAVKWYRLAASQGYDSAQVNLGIILANLPGKRRDLRGAISLYRKAARQGNRNAAFNLGLYYAEGRGVPQSIKLAKYWYQRAARKGDFEAKQFLKRLSVQKRR
jgi:uncharacterized protein